MDEILIINNGVEFLCENVGDAEGFEFPEARNVFIDPPSRGGSQYITSLPGKRRLSWRGLIKDNVQVNRRLLGRACQIGNLKTIQFTTCDGIALQTQVEIESLLNPYRTGRSPYMISAIAPNYRFLSQILHSQNTGITEVEGGMPIPAAIPAPIGGGSSLNFIVNNAGNENAQPTFVIRGPGTNFLIQNIDTGEKINLNITLLANEEVEINTENNSVFKGTQDVFGSAVRTPAGQWLELIPGNNRIVFNAQSGTGGGTRLTVKWRDTYSNI